jgi:hypothetical protein
MRAVENGNYEMVLLLIDHGADLNQSDDVSHKKIVMDYYDKYRMYVYSYKILIYHDYLL